MRKIIIYFLVICCFGLCFYFIFNHFNSNDNSDNDEEILMLIDGSYLLDFMDKEQTGYIYIGRDSCPHCREFRPVLEDVVKENNLSVFYYDLDKEKSIDTKNLVIDKLNLEFVPIVFKFENGHVVDSLSGTTDKQILYDFFN